MIAEALNHVQKNKTAWREYYSVIDKQFLTKSVKIKENNSPNANQLTCFLKIKNKNLYILSSLLENFVLFVPF